MKKPVTFASFSDSLIPRTIVYLVHLLKLTNVQQICMLYIYVIISSRILAIP